MRSGSLGDEITWQWCLDILEEKSEVQAIVMKAGIRSIKETKMFCLKGDDDIETRELLNGYRNRYINSRYGIITLLIFFMAQEIFILECRFCVLCKS